MIVRNEAHVIERCLTSVLTVIDYWVICDTGSTDGTPETITAALASIPGEMHHHRWVNFGVNRTQAIKIAQTKADYVLLIDADMVLNIHRGFKATLQSDSYLIQYSGSLDYWQTMLVKSTCDWTYIGPTHEYIHGRTSNAPEKLTAITLTHFADGGGRTEKFTRDIDLLQSALSDEPNNTRYLFYLAQSYAHLREFEQAMHFYRKRIAAGGWDEERWYAMYQLAIMLENTDTSIHAVTEAYLRAYEYRPSRAEPLYRLANIMRRKQRYTLALLFIEQALKIGYPEDILFVEKSVYEYLSLFEYAICAHYTGQIKEAIRANDRVINHPNAPSHIVKQALINKQFSVDKLIG